MKELVGVAAANSQDLMSDIFEMCEEYTPRERFVAILSCLGWASVGFEITKEDFDNIIEIMWKRVETIRNDS